MTPAIAVLEEAGYALWSTPDRAEIDGWVLRSVHGFTRRLNSATAIGTPSVDSDTRRRLEAWFGRRSLPLVIRVTPSMSEATVETITQAWGLEPEDVTHVMGRAIDPAAGSDAAEVCDPDDEFVELLCELNGRDMAHVGDFRATIDHARGPMAGIRIGTDAVGLVGVHGDLSAVFSVAVAPAVRRRGLGTNIMAAAMGWAHERGATYQFHQVYGGNTSAIAMYRSLGYSTIYDYHYLRSVEG